MKTTVAWNLKLNANRNTCIHIVETPGMKTRDCTEQHPCNCCLKCTLKLNATGTGFSARPRARIPRLGPLPPRCSRCTPRRRLWLPRGQSHTWRTVEVVGFS